MQSSSVLIFGDVTVDQTRSFQRLHREAKQHFQLNRFLTEAVKLLRDEIIIGVGLSAAEKSKIAEIADLVELAPGHEVCTPDSAAIAVQSVCAQIGEILTLAQSRPEILRQTSSQCHALGFGFGQLAAAVAETSHDLDEVVQTGLVAVTTALRLALELQRRAWDVEESTEAWACTLQGLTPDAVERLLNSFNTTRSTSHRAYTGVSAPEWTTVVAPPTDLARFCELPEVKALTKTYPAYPGSIHAPHMPALDLSCIVEPTSTLSSAVQERLEAIVAAIASERVSLESTLQPLIEANTDFDIITIDASVLANTAADVLKKASAASRSMQITDVVPTSTENNLSGKLAIVGMSGRFPESDTLDEFWNVLAAGTDCHKPIPTSRFDAEHYYNPNGDGQKGMPSKWGCFMKKPGNFDHRFFNISPKEATQMDPQQRILLMATWEALEMSGYNGRGNGRVAAYFGQTTDDYKHIQDQQGVETHYLPALNRGFAPGRLSHFFKWDAGFYSIDTGCSSSATCVCLAREALASGECDAAVVGGGALHTAPEWYSGLGKGGFLSKTGACKTYQATADGYCRGEAVAVLVIKRLEDAVKANDNVLAVIAGAARNGNAGAGSITHPGEDAQVALYQKALRQAGITGDDVTMVEMHGTGTQAGDKTEMAAVRRAIVNPRTTETPIPVGAVKAFVGHSEAAAGAVSLIKSVLMLDHGMIPRQPHWPFKLNPKIGDVENGRVRIANNQALVRPAVGPRSIVVNCFDAAGGNTSMVVQDAPVAIAAQEDPRSHHVIITTGKTQTAHENNRRRLRQYLTLNPNTKLSDLAYTTTARRMTQDMPFLATYSVSSIDELNRQLDRPSSTQPLTKKAGSQEQIFAFTGQGSQYNGMGNTLYKSSATFRRILDSLERLCTFQDSNRSFLDIIKGTQDVETATPGQLQMAIVALEIALARFWQRLGLKPSLTIGHSLGEYAGLCIAGVLSAKDALFLVHQRAALMTERCEAGSYGMLAVQLPASTLTEMIDNYFPGVCEISCLNGPTMTVVSGSLKNLKMVEENLKGMEVKSTPLPVQFAFHSAQLDPILEEFERLADESVNFRSPKTPVASTLLGRIVRPGEENVFNGTYLRRQMREPVDFVGAVHDCETTDAINNDSLVLEVGPTPVCASLIPRCLRTAKPQCISSLQKGSGDWESISRCMTTVTQKGAQLDWPEFHQDFLKSVRPIHDLPAYAFDLTEFWSSYQTLPEQAPVANAAAPRSNGTDLNLTALQKLESRETSGRRTTATFLSEVSDDNLHKMIWGHNVDGTAICPASVFIDMAYSAALYVLNSAGVSVDAASLEMEDLIMKSPLVAEQNKADCPTVRVHASYDSESKAVSIQFSSFMAPQAPAKEHGSCRLLVLPPNAAGWVGHWQRMQHLIQTRVHTLDQANRRDLHMINKDLMYKLFSEVVDYSKPYQCVNEIIMPLDFHDAAAQLSIASPAEYGQFTCNPFAMDTVVHLVGFLLNGDVARPKDKIHIASYIGRIHVLEDLSKARTARCYAAVRQSDRTGTTVCDAYVFDEAVSPAKLVAVCTDVRFNCLDQEFFANICGNPKSRSSSRASSRRSRSRRSSSRRSRRSQVDSDSEYDSEYDSEVEYDSSPAPSGRSTPISSAAEPDLAEVLLGAISRRSGISTADMDPSASFTAMGIDSQMSISILSDFKKLTGEELPASFFTTFPTVADVQEELGSKEEKPAKSSKGLGTQRAQSPAARPASRAPRTRASSRAASTRPSSRAPSRAKTSKTKKAAKATPSGELLKILADQLGMQVDELKTVTSFSSLGVDSMMSIKILGLFQKQTGVELPASFFNDYPSVAAIEEELDDEVAEPAAEETEPETRQSRPETRAVVKAAPAPPQSEPEGTGEIVSRAILIQGKSRNTDPALFLATDGSGTVESYINFPALPGGRRIYGLESPFADCPERYTLSIGEMCEVFIKAIQKVQPQGPYLIGGWSAGSVYAYEIARRLTERGHEILSLMILDMRVPSLIPRPSITMPFIERLGASEGLKGAKNFDSNLTERERAHLWATCRALARYYAVAFPKNQLPKNVQVVWATKGLNDSPDVTVHDNRVTIPAEMGLLVKDVMNSGMTEKELEEKFELIFKSWFYGKRLYFGTNGWEKLLGSNVNIATVEADHFSIVQQPAVKDLGDIILGAVSQATEV